MPEPIGIISVTALALSAAKTTKDFIDGIVDAPNSVTATTRDLESLNTILTLLLTQLQDPVFKDVQALDPIVAMLAVPLKNCTEETEKLRNLLKPFIKSSGAAKTGKWTRFTFKYREADIVTIQQRLNNYRASLDAAVGIAVLIISARSSKNVQIAGAGIDTLQRRIQRLLLHAGLDSSTASTSSYAASEILESVDDSRIMEWLREAGTSADDDEPEDADSALWSPEVVIGIDVGMTFTGVAYSLAPDFSRPIMFPEWPRSHKAGSFDEKVRTVVSYDPQSGTLLKFGEELEPHLNSDIIVQDRFLCFMNPEFNNRPEGAPSTAQAQSFYTDFLSCLYDHLKRRLKSILSEWNERGIEFIFSTPHYCTSPNLRRDLKRLIKSAGFGAPTKHRVSIVLTEQAILATVPLAKIPIPGAVIICDVGDVEMHISVCTTSMQAGVPLLDIIKSTTKQHVLFEIIDYYGKRFMKKRRLLLNAKPDASKIIEQSTRLGELIVEEVNSAHADYGMKVGSIVLSGGRGASVYTQWWIQPNFGGSVEVIVDAEAYTAATRGLVIHRRRELRLDRRFNDWEKE